MIAGVLSRLGNALGLLRILLAVSIFVLAATAPFADDGPIAYRGWAMWPRLVAPALAPMMLFVLLLEVMMTLIYRSSAEGAERRRLGLVLRIELVLVAVLVGSWLSFFNALL